MPSISLTWRREVAPATLPAAPPSTPTPETYTSEEIDASVSKIIQGAIRRPYGALGQRQTGTTFDDTMDAAAGVFILTPNAPFYVLLLGSKRLADLCTALSTAALSLQRAIESTGRRVKPLESITSLGNAKVALQALETASASRESTFTDITETPAFQRFDRHTDRFLSDSAANIRVKGQVVQTPQQAQQGLSGLVQTLTEQFVDVKRRVGLLAVGIDNYNSLQLPALLSQGVISKARSVLQDRIDQLEPLTPTDRLNALRDTTLDVLTTKAVVQGFGSLPQSGTFVKVLGTGAPFTDATHPGLLATITSDLGDPYSIVAGADSLAFTMESGPTLTVPLQQSFIAKLEGTVPEPFVIDGTVDKLTVTLEGFPDLSVTLTHGTRSITQVCANINAAVTTQPLLAEPFFNPEKFNGICNSINVTGSSVDFIKTVGTWADVGVLIGDYLQVLDGPMAGGLYNLTTVAGNSATGTLVGPGSYVAATGFGVRVGPSARSLRLRITDAGAGAALDASLLLGLPSVTHGAATTLGFFPGSSVRCRRTRGDEVALSINSSFSASLNGVARVTASADFVGSDPSNGRSDPSDPQRVVSSLFRTTGDVATGGTSALLTVSGAQTTGIRPGHIVTLRTAALPAEVGIFGTVTAVSDTSVSATMGSSISVGTGFDLEFGQAFSVARDAVVRVLSNSPSSGDYRTTDALPNPTEMKLDRSLPVFYDFGGLPLQFSISVGALFVNFKSTSTTLDSEISVAGTAGDLFFDSIPAIQAGATPYVLLENDPKVLGVGDLLEIYTAQYNAPEFILTIIGFELGQKLLQLDTPVPNGVGTLDFSSAIETPFARIRKVARNNYDFFQTQLNLWLALAVNQPTYLSNLTRLLNPLIVNENPTLSAVNSAKIQVQMLVQAIGQLQVVLSNYQVDAVPRVDTLVSSFLERGSDRAVDTLLEGRFTDFFGYNSEEMSYIGNSLERMRDVARLDLPVRKTDRQEVTDQELTLGQSDDPDFEFDQSDTQDFDEPNIPGSFIDVPGSNF
jgi:hypothetical protein